MWFSAEKKRRHLRSPPTKRRATDASDVTVLRRPEARTVKPWRKPPPPPISATDDELLTSGSSLISRFFLFFFFIKSLFSFFCTASARHVHSHFGSVLVDFVRLGFNVGFAIGFDGRFFLFDLLRASEATGGFAGFELQLLQASGIKRASAFVWHILSCRRPSSWPSICLSSLFLVFFVGRAPHRGRRGVLSTKALGMSVYHLGLAPVHAASGGACEGFGAATTSRSSLRREERLSCAGGLKDPARRRSPFFLAPRGSALLHRKGTAFGPPTDLALGHLSILASVVLRSAPKRPARDRLFAVDRFFLRVRHLRVFFLRQAHLDFKPPSVVWVERPARDRPWPP
eukprot:TRINITY_DN1043_c0_g1_i3.p1 TRINITY_DN1043_c0_g1~~TRINITY_DN1043_c0_g1_i3.p1  ORF type:complete len:343 (-),score=-2.63 TRINITY_DN1043_c0_g1_i3:1568-2596(-)